MMKLVYNTLLNRRRLFVFRWELEKNKGGVCIVLQYKPDASTPQQRLVKLKVQLTDMYHTRVIMQFLCAQGLNKWSVWSWGLYWPRGKTLWTLGIMGLITPHFSTYCCILHSYLQPIFIKSKCLSLLKFVIIVPVSRMARWLKENAL